MTGPIATREPRRVDIMGRSALGTWVMGRLLASLAAGMALAMKRLSRAQRHTAPAAATQNAFDDKWPKDVDSFLHGHYLDRSDVVLTRRTADITAAVIRWATNSPFSHAALVFTDRSSTAASPGLS